MITERIGSRSRMRAALAALTALALVATLVAADGAHARTLTYKRAKAMANDLVEKQLNNRKRGLLEARITSGRRVNRRVVRFLYDDLSRSGLVCTGVIQVRRSGLRFLARFRSSECELPGEEILSFRAQARVAGTRAKRKQRSVRRSVRRYLRAAQACDDVAIPAHRLDEASLLLSTGLLQARTRPLLAALDDYSATLVALDVSDPQLADGAGAWRHFYETVLRLPQLPGGYCGTLAAWARNGYSDASAPVDFAALRATAARLREDAAAVRRAGRHMRSAGIDPVTVDAFTFGDLIGETPITEA